MPATRFAVRTGVLDLATGLVAPDTGEAVDALQNGTASGDMALVVLDQHDNPLFRLWPIGTTWRLTDGTLRTIKAFNQTWDDIVYALDQDREAASVPARPLFDCVSPSGGAYTIDGSDWLPAPEDQIVVYAPETACAPAPGALFIAPNGDAWRLRSSNETSEQPPEWTLTLSNGAQTNVVADLPAGARLAWHP